MNQVACAGLLLTGGRSRRMAGAGDKAALFSERLGALLASALPRAFEVGPEPGWSGLPLVGGDAGVGPLGALAAAASSGLVGGCDVVVLACDMPFVTAELLGVLASQPAGSTAVPVADGAAQTLCARYSAADVARAGSLVAAGRRSMRALLDGRDDVVWLDGLPFDFADVDTPDDLARLVPEGVAAWPQSAGR